MVQVYFRHVDVRAFILPAFSSLMAAALRMLTTAIMLKAEALCNEVQVHQ